MNRGEAGGNGGSHRWEADFQEMPDLMELGTGSQVVVEWSGVTGLEKRSWGTAALTSFRVAGKRVRRLRDHSTCWVGVLGRPCD